MTSVVDNDSPDAEIERELVTLENALSGLEDDSTNALDVLGIESNERRLTRFLRWLLIADESHGLGDTFLNEFLAVADVGDIDVLAVESFFVVNQGPDIDNAEIDLVLIGHDTCIGVEIKTTHQEKQSILEKEHAALTSSLPSMSRHELLYLTFRPDDGSTPNVDHLTIYWSELLERFEDHLSTIPGDYEKQLITDFITTIRTNIMTEFNGLDERTEAYLEHAEAIDAARSAYEDDRDDIHDAIASEFFATDGIGDAWERRIPRSGNYIQFYKPAWQSLNNGVSMEFEPHVKLKTGGDGRDALDESYIRVRFDVEHGQKAQPVRDAIIERIGEKGVQELESEGFYLFGTGESSTKFISKPVPLTAESGEYDPIVAANESIQTLRVMLGDSIDTVAEEF